jgi:OmpA-OmpF porin, OOP family
MRTLLSLVALLSVTTVVAQTTDYNRFALEAQFGLNNPIAPMAPSYDAPTFGLMHAGLSGRYMLNHRFGLRLGTAYDRLNAASGSSPFTTDYLRVSGEGVVNMASVLDFGQWTDNIGLLFHAGGGYSSMRNQDYEGWDEMLHATFGITPQIRLGNRMALSVDMSVLAHVYQSRSYDFSAIRNDRGVDGFLYNLSVGLQYSFGKQAVYADWIKTPDLSKELEESRKRLQKLEDDLKDDDNDGVANYLDQEPGTEADAVVNTKGVTQLPEPVFADTDGDGLIDEKDDCPTVKGDPAMKGCPGTGEATVKTVEQKLMDIQFETRQYALTLSSSAMLDYVVEIMRANPGYKLEISGHTDNEGEEEGNQVLSERRANAVRNYLVSKGIGESRLSSRGMGSGQPVASNATEDGKARNRRVEFVIK